MEGRFWHFVISSLYNFAKQSLEGIVFLKWSEHPISFQMDASNTSHCAWVQSMVQGVQGIAKGV